jgi:hypothetical protein
VSVNSLKRSRFRRDHGDGLGQADAEVHDVAGADLLQAPAAPMRLRSDSMTGRSKPLAFVTTKASSNLAKGLVMHHTAAGDDVKSTRMPGTRTAFGSGSAIHHALHLRDDDAAVVFRRLRDGQHLADQPSPSMLRFPRASAWSLESAPHGWAPGVAQPGPAHPAPALDQLLGGASIQSAAAVSRIDEGVQPDLRDEPGRFAAISRSSTHSTPCGRL